MEQNPESIKIICAAILVNNQDIICSVRHYDETMAKQLEKYKGSLIIQQGFVDNKGNFWTREGARQIAEAANQIVNRVPNDEYRLFSENLY